MKKNLLMQYTVLSTYSDLKMHAKIDFLERNKEKSKVASNYILKCQIILGNELIAILYNALNKLINKLYL